MENASLPHSGEITTPTNILLTNISSILNRDAELEFVVDQQAPHVLALSEYWLRTDIEDAEVMVMGYKIFGRDRQNNRKGGVVLIYPHKTLLDERILNLAHYTWL